MVWGGVICFGGGKGVTDWFKTALRNVPLESLFLTMCCTQLGPQIAVLTSADFFLLVHTPLFLRLY